MVDVTTARDAVAALLDPEREAVTVIYPANAAALNQGPAGLMLSAAVVPSCDGCGQYAYYGDFGGRQIQGYYDRAGVLWVEAEFSMQHGCGTWAPKIVDVDWNVDSPFDPAALVAELRSRAETARDARDAATRNRLRQELAEFLALPEDQREPTGGDTEPGIYRDGDDGPWVAWDYTAGSGGDTWDTIDVTEADLEGAP